MGLIKGDTRSLDNGSYGIYLRPKAVPIYLL